jgi:Protein of unknown function (DUF1592)/Protein of unknown function (DUF1588)/Protein of unknown function (DUF1595)/Protein of unknown function (DUF1585)
MRHTSCPHDPSFVLQRAGGPRAEVSLVGTDPSNAPGGSAAPDVTTGGPTSTASSGTSGNGPGLAGTTSGPVPSAAASGVSSGQTSINPAPPGALDKVGLASVAIERTPSRVLSRLTNAQVLNAGAALLGIDTQPFSALLPDIAPNAGYSNSGYAQSQPYDLILGIDAAVKAMVGAVTDWPALTKKYGGCAENACLRDFIAAFGERAFRRPLQTTEVAALEPILSAASTNALSFEATAGLLVRALLQAPEFLYLLEDKPLTDFQLATRLAFFVADAPPDDELYAEAKAGTLNKTDRLSYHTDRLLAAHGDSFAHAFIYDYFNLRKAYQRTVQVDATTIDALVDSLQGSFAQLIQTNAKISSLLTTRAYVSNPLTASYLGQTATDRMLEAPTNHGFMGLVTHPAALIALSNAYEGSTVSRGLFLAHQLLCIPPTPPPSRAFTPADVNVALPANPTQRDEAEARLQDPACLGCHTQFEPYAFALNRWGGDGLYNPDARLADSGPITTSLGALTFTGYETFLPLIGQSAQYQRCTADHLVRYGLRHTEFDAAVVDAVLASTTANGAEPTFRDLVRAVVQQPAFSNR